VGHFFRRRDTRIAIRTSHRGTTSFTQLFAHAIVSPRTTGVSEVKMKLVYKLLRPDLITFPCPTCSQDIPMRAMKSVQFPCPGCGAALRASNAFVRGLTRMPVTIATLTVLLLQVHPWWRFAMLAILLALCLRSIAAVVIILVSPEIESCDAALSLTAALRKR
jgi:predicted RNA-binding Zn-ribbon protein involved in translation (DUF1610 family)